MELAGTEIPGRPGVRQRLPLRAIAGRQPASGAGARTRPTTLTNRGPASRRRSGGQRPERRSRIGRRGPPRRIAGHEAATEAAGQAGRLRRRRASSSPRRPRSHSQEQGRGRQRRDPEQRHRSVRDPILRPAGRCRRRNDRVQREDDERLAVLGHCVGAGEGDAGFSPRDAARPRDGAVEARSRSPSDPVEAERARARIRRDATAPKGGRHEREDEDAGVRAGTEGDEGERLAPEARRGADRGQMRDLVDRDRWRRAVPGASDHHGITSAGHYECRRILGADRPEPRSAGPCSASLTMRRRSGRRQRAPITTGAAFFPVTHSAPSCACAAGPLDTPMREYVDAAR